MAENDENQTEIERDPDAEGFIAGVSTENAVRALQAADNVGRPQWLVRATRDGFTAPNAIVDEYQRLLEEESAEAVAQAELEAREAEERAAAEAANNDLPADNDDWPHKRLDDYAAEHNIELAKNLNKQDKVAAILAAVNKE